MSADAAIFETRIDLELPVDLAEVAARLPGAVARRDATLWWATDTPEGIGTLALARTTLDGATPSSVDVRAWGPGGTWLAARAGPLLGREDDISGFVAHHRVIADAWRRKPLRFGRTEVVFDALLGAVLGQRVQSVAAARSEKLIQREFGVRAPGPEPLAVVRAADLVGAGSARLHRCGVERQRGDLLQRLAAEAPRLQSAVAQGGNVLRKRLLAQRGVGEWTTAKVLAPVLGDADAVEVGDYNLCHTVCWALAGEPRGTDERMLDLLEPYRGHRGRVVALIHREHLVAPRRGPRLAFRPVDRFD